jgi:phytoene dehydrogenase-like protein
MYENWTPVKSIVHVMMGVNMDFSKVPHSILWEPEETINIAGKEHKWLSLHHHCFDKSMAPEDRSAVEVWYDTEYEYWEELYKDKEAYKKEKKRIADYTLEQLDKRWPGFSSKVQVLDVPTPATYERYTGNWMGSPDGWYVTPGNIREQDPLRTLPGLDGLKMIGQWTAPFTGTVVAALTGRQVIQLMCREDNRTFTSSV